MGEDSRLSWGTKNTFKDDPALLVDKKYKGKYPFRPPGGDAPVFPLVGEGR